MKKVKNTDSKQAEQLKNVSKESKKNIKKAKNENPVQKIAQTNPNVAIAIKKEKQKKPKTPIVVEVKPAELDAKALEKIERKKAKKLAKKLKKKEKKEQMAAAENSANVDTQSTGQKKNKKKKPSAEEAASSTTKQNGQKKEKSEKKHVIKSENGSTEPSGQKKDKKKKTPRESEDRKERAPKDPGTSAATVFVGNLPTTVKRVQIAKLFEKFGGVQGIRLRTAAGQVLFKHKQRKLAGSLNAYVILKNAEVAQKALELNGIELKGNHLRVTPADAQKAQSAHDPKRTIFVGNLKYTANEKKLHEIFSNCGEIDYIRCLGNGQNGCKGVAYVCFKSPEAVGLALELNETLLDERPIHVERYSTKKLGAKEARDRQQASTTQQPKANGAQKRIDVKQQKGLKQGKANHSVEKKKKSDFHGVKATGLNKKKQNKKPNNEMRDLAKKIAPKIKKEEKA